jgi:hypothetical protein
MENFYLQPQTLNAAPGVFIALMFTLYLLGTDQKTRATWLLMALFGSVAVWCLLVGDRYAFYSESVSYFLLLSFSFTALILILLIAFLYEFPVPTHKRERRWTTGLLAAAWVVFLIYCSVKTLTASSITAFHATRAVFGGFNLFLSLYFLMMIFRKIFSLILTVQSDRKAFSLIRDGRNLWRSLRHPDRMEVRALRGFLALAAIILLWMGSVGMAQFFPGAMLIGSVVSNASLFCVLPLLYLHYAPQPSTILVKIVGSTVIFTALLFMALIRVHFDEVDRVYFEDQQRVVATIEQTWSRGRRWFFPLASPMWRSSRWRMFVRVGTVSV